MSLKEKLQKIADASSKQIPEAAQRVMHASTQDVANSIAARNIPKVGDSIPSFELPDSRGNLVQSEHLALNGPFVLSFFRGNW